MFLQTKKVLQAWQNTPDTEAVYVAVVADADTSGRILRLDLAATIYHNAGCERLANAKVGKIGLDDAAFWKLARCTRCQPPYRWGLLAS